MKKLEKVIGKFIQTAIDKTMGNGLMQEETSADGGKRSYTGASAEESIRRAGN